MAMDWTIAAALGQLLAALGVIVSVIYLAMQVKETNAQTRLASSQAVDNPLMASWDPIYIPENFEVWQKALFNPASLTQSEEFLFNTLMSRVLQSFNLVAAQYVRGTYDAHLFQSVAAYYAGFIGCPGGQQYWGSYGHLSVPEARAAIEREIEKNNAAASVA
jgi:hypothetical protein